MTLFSPPNESAFDSNADCGPLLAVGRDNDIFDGRVTMDVPTMKRNPTEYEQGLFVKLLSEPFPGRDELRDQIDHCLVTPIDANGSLRIELPSTRLAPVEYRVPIEGSVEDIDHVPIHLLLQAERNPAKTAHKRPCTI